MPRAGATILALVASVAAVLPSSHGRFLEASAQTPLDRPGADLRAHLALQALDRYLDTWNSRDPKRWAASLHYPHIRPGPGAFELSNAPEQYIATVDFARTAATGWHHSEWTARRVLQIGHDTVHVAGAWTRYTADGRELTGSVITYVITNQDGAWGVLSRFAAGPAGLDASAAAKNTASARQAVDAYFEAWNSHDHAALGAAMHYPFVRIGDGTVEVWKTPAEFLAGPEPGRQRTWFDTRVERAEVVQVSANGSNVAVTYSRRNRAGEVLSQYEALLLAVLRDGAWKIQALSTMGV